MIDVFIFQKIIVLYNKSYILQSVKNPLFYDNNMFNMNMMAQVKIYRSHLMSFRKSAVKPIFYSDPHPKNCGADVNLTTIIPYCM